MKVMKVMKVIKLLMVVLLISSFAGCNSYKYGASGEGKSASSLTFGVVKSKIIKGETTQLEILNIFGSPNIITKNKSNNEVWSYNKMSYVTKGGETSFAFGSKASRSTSTSSFDLIVSFDKEDKVLDYSVISTKF